MTSEPFSLADHGLHPGDEVRFRRSGARWRTGHVTGVNKDGSLTIHDGSRLRAIPPDCVEVPARGPRGGRVWHPLIPPNQEQP